MCKEPIDAANFYITEHLCTENNIYSMMSKGASMSREVDYVDQIMFLAGRMRTFCTQYDTIFMPQYKIRRTS